VKTERLRSHLCMAYPIAMATLPVVSHDVWERTPCEAQASMRALEARMETLASMVDACKEQVRTLQEQRNQTSRHSSRPPSSDPPQHERPPRPRRKRRRGGQPGHPGSTRLLIPVADVDAVVVCKPAPCLHCQAPCAGEAPTPWRHQGIEMPPRKPVVTEYQWHQRRRSACGEVTRAPWPAGVPTTPYGPRGQATVALSTGSSRLSKRTTQPGMDEVCGVPRRVGTLSQWEQATTAAVATPVEEARRYVHEQKGAPLDAPSGRPGDQGAW
jgi:transposase